MQQFAAASLAQRRRPPSGLAGSAPPGASPPLLAPRPLSIGLPSRERALEEQKANLFRFVQENTAAYAALPWEPFTSINPRLKFGVATAVVASTLSGCVGLRGVALREPLITRDEEEPIAYYPGLLVTDQLHELFAEQYYCPTSLELKALKWKEPGDNQARPMLIIGDPTSHAALINDGVRSGAAGTWNSGAALQKCHRRHQANGCSTLLCLMLSQLHAEVSQREEPARHLCACAQEQEEHHRRASGSSVGPG